MRRVLGMLLTGFLWGLTACLTTLELLFVWAWLRGVLYVMKYGAAENPYAAEDMEIAGICALTLLPLFLTALAWAVCRIVLRSKKRAGCPER